MKRDVFASSKRMDWRTPKDFFKKLDEEFHFEHDVCATSKNTMCLKFLDKKADALTCAWPGRCWMNPPYGREIGLWVRKAFQESVLRGSTIVCLVPARTDTAWWHDWANKATEIRFIRGRLKFENYKWNAPFPSALLIFKKGQKK